MLGHKLVHVLSRQAGLEVHTSVRSAPVGEFVADGATYHEGIDLGGGSRVLGPLLEELAPDIVINAIGAIKQKDLYAAMDETFFVNSTLPHMIPLLNPNPTGRVIHFSTDCVYRGDRGGYKESEAPDVEDLYGRSKAVGEIAYGPHLTIRTSIIGFETSGHLSLLGWFFRQPPGSQLRGFSRAIYSGLPTVTVSRLVRDLIVDYPELRGLYHVASEPINKLDLLQRLNETFELGHTITADESLVMDRSLDDGRFRAETGTVRPAWTELIAELKQDFGSLPYTDLYRAAVAV
jgi:dTDP-4-dehydrorhamnose reductase